jgi:hypothetical protein
VIQRAEPTTPLAFSPDGTRVAVVANFLATVAAPTRLEPYVVNLDGTGIRRLFTVPTACGTCDADQLAWTADSSGLYMLGDVVTNNDAEVFRLDPALTDQTPTLAADAPVGGDVINLLVVGS